MTMQENEIKQFYFLKENLAFNSNVRVGVIRGQK